jgi:hypothetical protein
MGRQELSYVQLSARMPAGWSPRYLAMRLGGLLPGGRGGRAWLTGSEIGHLATALRVPFGALAAEQVIADADGSLAHIRKTWVNAFAEQQAEAELEAAL